MNKIVSKLYIALLATLVTLLSACTPETYELGSQLLFRSRMMR